MKLWVVVSALWVVVCTSGLLFGRYKTWVLNLCCCLVHLSNDKLYQIYRVRGRKARGASMSIASALWPKDEVSIATAGAADSVLKFCDTRNLKSIVTQTCPQPESTGKQILHGISSLSQDDSGLLLSASCMDSRYPPKFNFLCESNHGFKNIQHNVK
ncbi:hypothetical protein P8452_50180 [Trifolium repens]|nr:hypothetical protein P8452_50180 [Trifolium repens]